MILLSSAVFMILAAPFLSAAQGNSQWHIVKRIPRKTTQVLNVDAPRVPEMRAPIIESASFADDAHGWAVGDDGTLLKTVDGGAKWSVSHINPRIYPQGVFFLNKSEGWVVGNHRRAGVVLRTGSGGRLWQVQFRVEGFELSSIHSIWFTDGQNGWAVGEAQKNGSVKGVIFGTKDGGKTWALQHRGGGEGSFLHEVKFSDPSRGWAVGDGGIFYTSDGGQEWRRQRGAEQGCCYGLEVVSADEAWVVGGWGVILRTSDGGLNWRVVQLPSAYARWWLDSVKFVSPSRGWVAGDGGAIFSTGDGGQTWQREATGTGEFIRAVAATKEFLFAFADEGLILRRPLLPAAAPSDKGMHPTPQ